MFRIKKSNISKAKGGNKEAFIELIEEISVKIKSKKRPLSFNNFNEYISQQWFDKKTI